MNQYLVILVVLAVSISLEFITSAFMSSGWLSIFMSFMCLWIFNDGMIVAMDLRMAEKRVADLLAEREKTHKYESKAEEILVEIKKLRCSINQTNARLSDIELHKRHRMGSTHSPPLPIESGDRLRFYLVPPLVPPLQTNRQ